uniref:Uncharacterized protein n=1 Tax=Romanomermis culicivorax TaxID=13658 RepID=A0A915I979_ROMCU
MYESIKTNLYKAAHISKKYFNQKARKRKINVNDLVLLTNKPKANKIQPDFMGPFIVTGNDHLDGNVVTIDALDASSQPQTIFALWLKPFIPHTARDALVNEAVSMRVLKYKSSNVHYMQKVTDSKTSKMFGYTTKMQKEASMANYKER